MLPDKIRQYPTKVPTAVQRDQYFRDGFLILPDFVPLAWIFRLQAALAERMERSRAVTQTDEIFILEEGHSAATPRLHRITSPQDRHPAFWEFFTDPVITDLAADVVGPDVKFHHAKLNVKSEMGTHGFKWHQDIQGWSQTDFSPVPFGIYINGCTAHQGDIVRGQRAMFASFDTTPCEVPPDFRAGYRPPWLMQKEQDAHAAE